MKIKQQLLAMLSLTLLLSMFVTPAIIAGPSTSGKGKKPIAMFIDGRSSTAAVSPVLINGSVYVPLRHVAQTWKSKVSWNNQTRQITLMRNGVTFVLALNKRTATKNKRPITLSAAPVSINNTTMVPVRFIGESFGAQVNWNATLQKVSIHNYVDKLPVVGSFANLKKLLAKQMESKNRFNGYLRSGGAPIAMADNATSGGALAPNLGMNAPTANKDSSSSNTSGGGSSTEYSSTNTQVAGVDESDVIKNDGKYVYQVIGNQVLISSVYPADSMEVVARLKFTDDASFNPSELYVDGKKLVVIGNTYEIVNPAVPSPTNTFDLATMKVVADYYYGGYYRNIVKALTYDISDLNDVKLVREFRVEGNYVSSRKIGNYLYLIANKYFDYYAMQSQSTSGPAYYDSSVSKEWLNVDFGEIRYFPDSMSQQFLMIAGIDIGNTDNDANLMTFLGSGEQVYASTDNLYVTMAKYEYKVDPLQPTDDTTPVPSSPAIIGDALPTTTIAPALVSRAWWWRPAEVSTLIYKFSMDQGAVNFVASGSAPGTVLNQFSMDEHNDYFRVATTKTEYTNTSSWSGNLLNQLYVFDSQLNPTGKIENIAPGEKIYSVRFVGDRAYMVTFKTVDPLFVIDLKDPANPSILGELKIPGYSNYLHPYDENHIIGIGKDTFEQSFDDPYSGTTNSFAYYAGMKIALFDVTDVNNPVEKFVERIGDRGTDSELLYNHKALLFSKEKNLFALPVTLMKVKSGSEIPSAWQYGEFAWQGAYIYKLDLENGFQLQKQITHYSDEELAQARTNYSYWWNSSNVKRILFIKDKLLTVSNKKIQANELNGYDYVNEVQFDTK